MLVKIINGDLNNGDGLRVSIWFSGCDFKCKGCHNRELWDKKLGRRFTTEDRDLIRTFLSDDYVDGLSILGGEPLSKYNLISLKYHLPNLYEFAHKNNKDVWLWTGYTMEEIMADDKIRPILDFVDVIITGRFVEELKGDYKYFGSSNQIMYKKINKIFVRQN